MAFIRSDCDGGKFKTKHFPLQTLSFKLDLVTTFLLHTDVKILFFFSASVFSNEYYSEVPEDKFLPPILPVSSMLLSSYSV